MDEHPDRFRQENMAAYFRGVLRPTRDGAIESMLGADGLAPIWNVDPAGGQRVVGSRPVAETFAVVRYQGEELEAIEPASRRVEEARMEARRLGVDLGDWVSPAGGDPRAATRAECGRRAAERSGL